MNAVISGCGWVTPAGSGQGPLPPGAFAEDGQPKISDASLVGWAGGTRFGRLDLFSRTGVAAVAMALKDAGLAENEANSQDKPYRDIALIAATVSGSRKTDQEFYRELRAAPGFASPGLFVYTLASSFVGEAALRFGLGGSTMALNESSGTGLTALSMACEMLAMGDDSAVLVGVNNLFPDDEEAEHLPQGACFLVLERIAGRRSQTDYGMLAFDKTRGKLVYRDRPVCSLVSVAELLAGKTGK
jgi:3-oxoacyl-[acyl-carrier-protein] synthase II